MNRKRLSRLFFLLLGLLICAIALGNISFTVIKTAFQAIRMEVLLLFILGILFGILIRAQRYYLLLSIADNRSRNSPIHKLSSRELKILSVKATAARNVGMGLLPARIGELLFVGIMKKGGVGISSGLGAVGIAWIFDASALLILLAVLMFLVPAEQIPADMYFNTVSYAALVLGVVMLAIIFLIPEITPYLANIYKRVTDRVSSTTGTLSKIIKQIDRYEKKLEPIHAQLLALRNKKRVALVFLLSLLLRVTKYSVLSMLLLEILPIVPDGGLKTASWKLLVCFIVAEGSTGIPGANFLGFGGYELAFGAIYKLLFEHKIDTISHVFTVHLLSQSSEALLVFFLFIYVYIVKKLMGWRKGIIKN